MRIQVLSDLHLEVEDYVPTPAPGADVLVLAGDIDSSWRSFERFAGWPVPVIFVAGNHEFDRRELDDAWPALQEAVHSAGLLLLECRSVVITSREGQRIRFAGTVRWCDFDLFGPAERDRCLRAGRYFAEVMRAQRGGALLDAAAVRTEALSCRRWLHDELHRSPSTADEPWDRTVVVTHFAPSLASADPRYGRVPATASFCNADDDLLPLADVWIHGHLHCRHDYRVPHERGSTRVVSNARGYSKKEEPLGHDGQWCIDI